MPISEDNKYLLNLLLANQSEDDLRRVAREYLAMPTDGATKEELIDAIIASYNLFALRNGLDINDFRICSVCGEWMHQGYCCSMGWKYYCSDECLRTDFTKEEWKKECEEDDQSYWTDWYQHYELTNILHK